MDIKAIDALNYPTQCCPEVREKRNEQWYEYRKMFESGLFRGGYAPTQNSLEEMIAEMDETGYEKVIITAGYFWSYREQRLVDAYSVDIVRDLVERANGRVVGGASYNPFRIMESLQEIEQAIKKYGFKYVYFHGMIFGTGMKLNDRKFYPLYAKCCELGVPVGMQVGHSAEALPSETGHPMFLDRVALDFPDLKIVLSHTGWPWTDEFTAMVRKHQNVYGDISAWPPKTLPKSLVEFLGSRLGQDKILFGTNGLGFKMCKEQFLELPIRDEAKSKILRENALKLFNL